ncbi:AAA family ATPase [Sorangium sp. So ce834]|uniref:AAA family ATPase n=1 Tax=Sorangium sp. So ce834 TaxID=3133321 RepID=UPI003F621452
MSRRFNTAGPCSPDLHYMLPAAERLPEAPALIEQASYFVVHAPRQTGKTTTLRALAEELTASGRQAALHFSCETGETAGDDYAAAQRAILDTIRQRAEQALPAELRPPPFPPASDTGLLVAALRAWAEACPRPLALFFDEIDALRGQGLLSVLRQLRSGFPERPDHFPASVVLCGLRDVRDYKARSGGDPSRLGTSSPFNVKVESIRLGDFTRDEVRELYGQHAEETGQPFTDAAIDRAAQLTGGQPWLVNAMGREIVEKMRVPPAEAITAAHVEEAKERLILARATHLDSLVARLMEPRVRRVLEPLLEGGFAGGDTYDDDASYVRDLGLVAPDRPLRIANPIYREVIVRVLASPAEDAIAVEPRAFVRPDGRFDVARLLREFAAFWREHGAVLAGRMPYHEVAPQLVLMAYLQRVVNGGGHVDREYGVGRGRIDLLVRWPHTGEDGKRAWQREAIELKVWRAGEKDPLPKALTQIDAYLDGLSLDTGVVVIFDRRPGADPESGTRFEEALTPSGRRVTVLRA